MLQDTGDTPKQLDIDILFPENLVDIGAGTAQLRCEPSNGPSLLVEDAFDELSGVNRHFALPVSVPGLPKVLIVS